ncbi:MAG TPA: hypothetical protein H9896_04675 [Candidatus Pygmaiobacter gallistercoris]|nr:hypothetical protein [Candidatus Pygmaiobacter gallistercoris]
MKRVCRRLAALLLAALLLTGCGGESESLSAAGSAGVPAAQQNEGAGAFVLPYTAAEGFNPYLSSSALTLQNSRLLYDSLVDITGDYQLDYNIAQSVTSSGTTVEIRVAGSFADGTAVTGQDVAACIEAARKSALFAGRFAKVTAVRASGDLVTLTLAEPDSLFAYLLDIPVLKASEVGERTPTPSGRYSLGEDDRGAFLSANADFTPPEGLETIRLEEIGGYEALVSALNIGEISLLASEQESDLAGSNICSTAYYNLNNLVFLGIEASASAPLAQTALRQAISLGISRREIADRAYSSRAYVATGVINPRFPGQAQAATLAEEPDVETARGLIESLGYTLDEETGFYQDAAGNRLSFSLLCYSGSAFKRSAAGLIAQQLADCGIEITLQEEPDFAAYREKILSGQAPLYIGEVKLYNNMAMDAFFTDGGEARTGLALSEELLAAYRGMKADIAGLAAFETAFAEQMPFVPLVYKNGVVTYARQWSGLTPTVSDIFYQLEQLTTDPSTQKEETA